MSCLCQIFYNKDQSSYKVCDATGEDFTCSDAFLFNYDVQDHVNYLGVVSLSPLPWSSLPPPLPRG